ncbi:Synaptotagmin-4-like, partial [Scleropages formosus]
HLQILLGVGLAVFCFSLILGCYLCWRRMRPLPPADKQPAEPPPPITAALSIFPSAGTVPVWQQYEGLDGVVLDHPAPVSRPLPSQDNPTALPFGMRPHATSELGPQPGCFLPLRRLSSPAASCSALKPQSYTRASLPSIPKLGLVSRTHRALERRSTVAGDAFLCGEQSRLTGPASRTRSSYLSLESSTLPEAVPSPRSSKLSTCLHFTLLYSPTRGTLTVTTLGLSGSSRRLGGAYVRATLPPLCPTPVQPSARRRSLSPELHRQIVVLPVSSVEQLRTCTLQLAVLHRDFSGFRETVLGQLEMLCAEVDWEPDQSITCSKELSPARGKLKKSQSSQDALGQGALAQRSLGQLYILLQYQTPAHRIKVMVRKAESLARLSRMPGSPDHYVVINLRHNGVVISTKETKGATGYSAVWNAPFLFDLPQGDISQLSLLLEFIIMQGRIYTKNSVLGHVLIGNEAPEPGLGHWREMCHRRQMETAHWHAIQPKSFPQGEEI